MKTYFRLLFIIMVFIQISCNSNNQSGKKEPVRIIGSIPVADTVRSNRFSKIIFASKFDTSCGMPLTAGLKDTLNYKGKVYGFCSKECKDAFASKLNTKSK